MSTCAKSSRKAVYRSVSTLYLPTDLPSHPHPSNQVPQIIVKLVNTHLTLEKPTYGSGTRHIEGQLNEHICAAAIYYYDNVNITDSHLAFCQKISTEDMVEKRAGHDDYEGVEYLYKGVT